MNTGHLPAQVASLVNDLGTHLSPQLPPRWKGCPEQGEFPAPEGFKLRPLVSRTLAERSWQVLGLVMSHTKWGVARW